MSDDFADLLRVIEKHQEAHLQAVEKGRLLRAQELRKMVETVLKNWPKPKRGLLE